VIDAGPMPESERHDDKTLQASLISIFRRRTLDVSQRRPYFPRPIFTGVGATSIEGSYPDLFGVDADFVRDSLPHFADL